MSQTSSSAERVVRELSSLPALGQLLTAVRSAALTFDGVADPVNLGPVTELSARDAATPCGNVVESASRETPTRQDRLLLGALLSQALKEHGADLGSPRLARRILWLSRNTSYDALPALGAALGDDAEPLFRAICELAASGAPDDPGAAAAAELSGELTWTPKGPVATALLAFSGLLLVRNAAAVLARHAFSFRRPAQVKLSERGLEVSHRIELLGRVVRNRDTLVPLENLASVTREVRYARAGLYAGLVALVLGTYFGMGLLVDGVRAPGGSPSLLAFGLLLIAVGLGLDFLLSTVLDSAKKSVRLVVVPRKGRAVCVRGLAPEPTDALLRRIAESA